MRPFLPKQEISKLLGDNPVIIEIGCSNGYDTVDFIRYCGRPDLKIFAFEPDPRGFEKAKRVCENIPNIKLFNMAVSNKTGWQTFNLVKGLHPNFKAYGDFDCASSLLETIKNEHHFSFEEIKVKTITLDWFCQIEDIKKIDFAWIDVEGATELIFKGAGHTLPNIGYIYVEYSDVERYAGEPNLEKIQALLPMFDTVEVFENDVLLRNKKWT